MKTFLFNIPKKLHNLNDRLDITSLLCGRSWIVFNDEGYKQVLIFEENGSLIVSINGDVVDSKWKYISANRSLLITIEHKTMMFHPTFLDDNIFALQKDGIEECLFMIDEAKITEFLPMSIENIMDYFENIKTIKSAQRAIEERKVENALSAEQQIEEIKKYIF